MASYILTEHLISASSCHIIHCALDDKIPFNEYFAPVYFSWFVLVFGSLLYALLFNVENFKRLQIFIIITQVLATIFYIAYPNMQDLRPEIVENHNLCSQVLIWLYSIDTPTGVCPSLHVAITSGVLSVGLRDKDLKPIWKILLIIYFIIMCYAVCAVKQHSVIDVFGGILLGIATELLVIILQRKTHAY